MPADLIKYLFFYNMSRSMSEVDAFGTLARNSFYVADEDCYD